MNSGFVYCLSNPAMPGLVKIGHTCRSVDGRALELYTSGVPCPFRDEYSLHVADRLDAEEAIHAMLDRYRVSSAREFFMVSVESARNIMDVYANEAQTIIAEGPTEESDPTHSLSSLRAALEDTYTIDPASQVLWTTARELIQHVVSRGFLMSDAKIGRELGKLGLTRLVKRIDGKTVKAWGGIGRTGNNDANGCGGEGSGLAGP